MRSSYFFIVGAPKCGTTSLAAWLRLHPRTFMTDPKEPHYFNNDMANRLVKDRDTYIRLFSSASEQHLALGEASTWYFYSKKAVPAIEKELPGSRYIVMLRHPVEMVQSLYAHNVLHCHENARTLEEAWNLQHLRSRGQRIPRLCREPDFLQYREACALGSQLERLYRTAEKKRVLTLWLDDIKVNPRNEYLRVLDFLGVPDDGRTTFPVANERRQMRSRLIQQAFFAGSRVKKLLGIKRRFGLVKLNERPAERVSVCDRLLREIRTEMHPELQKLEILLGRSLSR